MADDRTVEQFASQGEFRSWLAANHASSEGIWLKIAKKGVAVSTVTYDEALEVALIFGWIDGQKRALDATFWLQGFTRRGPRSVWSKRNRDKAQALIDAGRMEPSGLAAVDRAKADGRWAKAYDGQRDAREPSDLLAALAAKPAALEFYRTLDSVNRYAILYRIQDAKRPETRAARIAKFAAMLDRGDKLYP
ncbi:MAG: YdeI/OmpD-associated family protein [Chloroflexi bacterium]|nr:YdeI/OmpD-associated family protein [Chloroflexota bacterium]